MTGGLWTPPALSPTLAPLRPKIKGKREGETDAEEKGETFLFLLSPLFLSTPWRSGGEGRLFSRSIRPGRGRGHSGGDPNPEGPHYSFIEKMEGKIVSLFIVHSIFLFQIAMSQTIPNNILWNPPQAQHEVSGGWATFSDHWTSKERVLDSYLSGGGSEQKLFSFPLSLGFVRGEGGKEGLLQKWGKGGWERIKSFSSFLFPFLVSCSECSFGCTCPRTCLDILLYRPRTLSFRDACGTIRGRSRGGEMGKNKDFFVILIFDSVIWELESLF